MKPRARSWHVPAGMRPAQPGIEPRVDPMARLAVPVSTAASQPAGAPATHGAPDRDVRSGDRRGRRYTHESGVLEAGFLPTHSPRHAKSPGCVGPLSVSPIPPQTLACRVVTAIADSLLLLALDSDVQGEEDRGMKSDKPLRRDRGELIARGFARAALLAGVVWVWLDAGGAPS